MGVLLHPTSLPGPYGCGDIGPAAHRFLEFLAACGAGWWQMLPTHPPAESTGCPYSTDSSRAGNPLLISLDCLIQDGLLTRRECEIAGGSGEVVDYPRVMRHRERVFRLAFSRFRKSSSQFADFARFCRDQAYWLNEYALFAALRRENQGRPWYRWPMAIRTRRPAALAAARGRLEGEIDRVRFEQFLYANQWRALHRAARERGIGLIGDVPIFVGHDSCDVWANPSLFMLNAAGGATLVTGVPPDKFSRTGQVWNHPHYRWKNHRASGFAWWIERFRSAQDSFDAVRVDHFLGFVRSWAIPGGARTAVRGKWVATPGRALFSAVRHALGTVHIIAEDLGLLTPEAAALRDEFGFPGMRVLQWGFGADGDSCYHQPHRFIANTIAYPGTHDNDTIVGWFHALQRTARTERERSGSAAADRLLHYCRGSARRIHWDVIRMAVASPANLAIIAMQDLLGLDSSARMNLPGTVRGNWRWRMRMGAASGQLAAKVREMNRVYERLSEEAIRETPRS